jgi:hypothetical protein
VLKTSVILSLSKDLLRPTKPSLERSETLPSHQKKLVPDLDFHPSTRDRELDRAAAQSLQANRINPKLLYVTSHQTQLWRRVFLRHSPLHANPGFARIYPDAFSRIMDHLPPGKIFLVGLGCGTGAKELQLQAALRDRGHDALFAAIDVSRDLVIESVEKLAAAGAEHRRSLVCDLAQSDFLGEWLNRLEAGLPRLITFFGLVPNLDPSVVARLFRSILRPGDILLVNAHLAPVNRETGRDLPAAMQAVLPQYDNPETRAWLAAALEYLGLENRVNPPEIKAGQVEAVPAFLATARWKTEGPFEKGGRRFSPHADPLRLFHSLRYTPALFEKTLGREGLRTRLLSITPCRQEAIWSVRNP